MPIIKLIVTGDMEKGALHTSLQEVFRPLHQNQAVEWLTPHKAHAATSCRLPRSEKPTEKMVALANIMIAEVLYSKIGKRPDLVLVIDDVELHNTGQEALIATHFRLAIAQAIKKSPSFTQKEAEIRLLLRKRCSFHLLKPMVESYLFGDTNALRLITNKIPQLPQGLDLEEFETNDEQYLPHCHAINGKHPNAPDWREECHPKRYLQFLNPDYSETKEGRKALAALKWGSLTTNNTHLQVIRALFADLADCIHVANPLPGQAHPVFWPPTQNNNENDMVLRNL
jgi:hypothetical protein